MYTLPQLIEEDLHTLDGAMRELVQKSESTAALLIDKGGFLITQQGSTDSFDGTTVAALGAGSFCANKEIANLIGEEGFASVYQQGDKQSLLVVNVDEHCLLCVIFKSQTGVGAVKYYASDAVKEIAAQLKRAGERSPGAGFDLSVLNIADTDEIFRSKTA
ncbi:MAG TPA: roadblock/LC7 domain-containing protein [Verrucomicrobiae bacterium]|jgi:predicted regulator of Ras-like GTPase activity (Roadblock/LC7/MglB family)